MKICKFEKKKDIRVIHDRFMYLIEKLLTFL